jgi:NAD(P)-dependent dehydrogenase (short-subunit alcohol dehydrogenase family)
MTEVKDMKRLQGKIAIVTGGGRGLGRAVVMRYVEEGAQVLAVSTGESAHKIAAEAGPAVVPYLCDVSQPDQVGAMVDFCRDRFGKLDILCNNAGIGHARGMRLHEFDLDTWRHVLDVNLTGAFLVLRSAIALMLESGKGGAIVNMSSYGAFRGGQYSTAYRVTKAGMIMLTKQAAVEYANDNIRVNAVCPGTIATDIQANLTPEEIESKAGSNLIKRLGRPEEVASLTAYLSSDEASFITGCSYLIDGGRSVQ